MGIYNPKFGTDDEINAINHKGEKLMSQGERSCKMFGNCNHADIGIKDCNVDCDFYNALDGVAPDSISTKPETESVPELKGPILGLSDLPKFDKNFEFVVLKKHVFYMQSISPKKIILKFKRKLKDNDNLPDGTYCFNDETGNKTEFKKVFKMFNTKKKAEK